MTARDKDKEEAFDYDVILEYTGQMGKFQLRNCILLFFPVIFPGMAVMSYTFTAAIPQYSCQLTECPSVNSSSAWSMTNFSRQDACYRYNPNLTDPDVYCQPHYTDADINDTDLLQKCDSWVYNRSTFESTIVTDFDLTCGDEWKVTMASTVYMFGMFVGATLLGNIADIFGRRMAFTMNAFLLACSMTATAFVTNFPTFCALRFFTGVSAMGQFLITFVWGVEATGLKYRTMVGCMYNGFFSVGCVIVGIAGYFIRDWRTLQLVISIPMFIPLVLYWIVPESIRWLITKKRLTEARDLIDKAAKMNGKTVPEHLLFDALKSKNIHAVVEEPPSPKSETFVQIFRTRVLCIRIFVMCSAWIAVAMSYYGISFSAANLSGNFYLNFELLMIVEIPSHFFYIYMMGKAGRRATLCGGLFICGLACLAAGLVPKDPYIYQVLCSLIGKFFAAGNFDVVFTYTAELFPTGSRSSSIGLCSTFGRIGSMMSPIIANLGRNNSPEVPFIIFAVINIIVGFVCLFLPETNNETLPATIQQAKDLSKNNLPCFRSKENDSN